MKRTDLLIVGVVVGLMTFLVIAVPGRALAQTWIQLAPSGGPPPVRIEAVSGYNPTTNRMIVFGGLNGPATSVTPPHLNDVWVLQNTDGLGGTAEWIQLFPAPDLVSGSPSPRGEHAAVYDPTSNRLIVFGGNPSVGTCSQLNDVWVLQNADGLGGTALWTKLSPTGGPPIGRGFHTTVYDPATNRMIVFSGRNCFTPLYDVWVLTNANGQGGSPTWTQLSPAGGPPTSPDIHTAVYDPATNRMIVFGGGNIAGTFNHDVWVLSNANGTEADAPMWTKLIPTGGPPDARVSHKAVYAPANNRMIVFGGCCGPGGRLNDVWVLANANGLGGTPNWTQLSPTGGPPSPRDGHTAVYNPTTNRMIVFSGRSCGPGFCVALNDVWVLTDASGVVTVPFAAFDAKAEIVLGPLADDDSFEVKSTFTLGTGSDGIDPVNEDVSFQVGTFSTTISAGSFKQDKKGRFKFEGVSDGVALEAVIQPLGGDTYEFKAEGANADLTGTVNPVDVALTIGDDSGSTTVEAEFE